jgi:hypothetical protein
MKSEIEANIKDMSSRDSNNYFWPRICVNYISRKIFVPSILIELQKDLEIISDLNLQ